MAAGCWLLANGNKRQRHHQEPDALGRRARPRRHPRRRHLLSRLHDYASHARRTHHGVEGPGALGDHWIYLRQADRLTEVRPLVLAAARGTEGRGRGNGVRPRPVGHVAEISRRTLLGAAGSQRGRRDGRHLYLHRRESRGPVDYPRPSAPLPRRHTILRRRRHALRVLRYGRDVSADTRPEGRRRRLPAPLLPA